MVHTTANERSRPRPTPISNLAHIALRYGLAFVAVAVALGLAHAFLSFGLPQPFAVFALCAIAITFWFAGIGPGIFATVLAAVVRSYLFEAEVSVLSRVVYALLFVVFAALMIEATKARHALEIEVARRTADLLQANENLQREVAQRKRIEVTLRQNEAYLADAQELTHTGSWALNATSKSVVHWSEETFRIFGFDPHEGVPPQERFWQRVHPDDRERAFRVLEQALRDAADFTDEFRIVLPAGNVRYIHVAGHAVKNADGKVLEVFGTHVDITEQKRAEQEREKLRELEADLAHVNRISILGELAASLSHELKQPVAAAITNAQTCLRWLARDEPDLVEAREAATRVVHDGNRANEFINRLRTFYTKGAPAERELVDLNDLIGEIVALLRSEASRYAITIRTDLAAELPHVTADRVQLQQVLMNHYAQWHRGDESVGWRNDGKISGPG